MGWILIRSYSLRLLIVVNLAMSLTVAAVHLTLAAPVRGEPPGFSDQNFLSFSTYSAGIDIFPLHDNEFRVVDTDRPESLGSHFVSMNHEDKPGTPFWNTWGFRIGVLLFLIAAVIVGVQWRLEGIRNENRRLEMQLKTAELSQTNLQLEQEVIRRELAEKEQARRAAEDLYQSEARFRAMFDDAAVGIGLLSLDGKVLEANPAIQRMLGYSPEEMVASNLSEMIHPEDRFPDSDLFKELVNGERNSYLVEKRFLRKEGEPFWCRLTISLVRDIEGQPKFIVGMLEDIDDQKRAGERLAEQDRQYRQQLEQRVEERTQELSQANEKLQQEIAQRQRIEAALAQKAADEAVVAERTRLARELHDAVSQTLFSASLIAEVLPDLWQMDPQEGQRNTEELRQLTRGALAEMRTLLLELRPAVLTQTRFEDLLRQLTEALVGRARLPIQLNIEGQRNLDPDVQVALYRIAQEALNNVAKYARASQVWVDVQLGPGGVQLSVRDNGIGYDPSTLRPDSLGLSIMRERAEGIGAELVITSQPGQGTQVEVTWNDPDMEETE